MSVGKHDSLRRAMERPATPGTRRPRRRARTRGLATVKDKRGRWRKWIAPYIGGKDQKKLTRDDVETERARRRRRCNPRMPQARSEHGPPRPENSCRRMGRT